MQHCLLYWRKSYNITPQILTFDNPPLMKFLMQHSINKFIIFKVKIILYYYISLKTSSFVYILSTGVRPSKRIPLYRTCLAAPYSARRAVATSSVWPATHRTS